MLTVLCAFVAVAPASLSVRDVIDAFVAAVSAETGAWTSESAENEALAALVDDGGHLRGVLAAVAAWTGARGIAQGGLPSLIINGRLPARLGGVDLQVDGMPLISEDMQTLQKAVQAGLLDDSVAPSVYAAFLGRATRLSTKHARSAAGRAINSSPLSLPGAGTIVPRFNAAIFAPPASQRFLPLSAPEAAPLLRGTAYVGAAGTGDAVKSVSLTVLDDLSSQAGLATAAAALAFVKPRRDDGSSYCFTPSGTGCFALPARFTQGLSTSGMPLHI